MTEVQADELRQIANQNRADRPCMDWGDATDECGASCVVAMLHDTDRLKVGMAIHSTEAGAASMPNASDLTKVEKVWGRIYTLREQWQSHQEMRDLPVGDGPPARWYADDGTSGWAVSETPREGWDEIWVVSWS